MNLCITDKSGKKFWNTTVSAAWAQGERRNLARHLAAIKSKHPTYEGCGVDAESARVVEELDRFDEQETQMSDDELLAQLLGVQ